MKGKSAWMVGVATVALIASGQAYAATKHHHHHTAATTPGSTAPAAAPAAGPSNAELEARISALEQQVESDESKADTIHTRVSTLEQNFNDVSWSFDNGRPTIKSGDGRFTLSLRARVQIDVASYMQPSHFNPGVPAQALNTCGFRDLCSGADVRRAYFGIEGKAFNDFNYELRLNFGGTGTEDSDPRLNLARIAYVGIPHFRINAGIIQPVLTYGNSVSSAELTFMEFPSVVAAVISAGTSFGGDDSRRGIELDWQNTDVFMPGDNLVIAATYSGQRTATPRTDDEGTFANGRVAYRLWSDGTSNVQIGFDWGDALNLQGARGHSFDIADRPESRVDGTRLINTAVGAATNCGFNAIDSAKIAAGNAALGLAPGSCTTATGAFTYGFEAGFNWENFYGAGEYYNFTVNRDRAYFAALGTAVPAGDPNYNGWYLEGSWMITGEVKPYSPANSANNYAVWGAPVPSRPFSLAGDSWGAWELAARYSELNLNWHAGALGTPVAFGAIRGGDQKIISANVNWYLNRNVRTMFEYQNVNVSKLTAAGLNGDESFNTLMARLQFAF